MLLPAALCTALFFAATANADAGGVWAHPKGLPEGHTAEFQAPPFTATWDVQNPHDVPVTEVHMVQSAHFDAGCKTPRCGT